MRRYHDMGGQPGEPIDTADHATEPWAKTLTAIFGALQAQGLSRVDEIRRQVVDMAVNGSGIRDTARVLRISPTTVIAVLKKSRRAAARPSRVETPSSVTRHLHRRAR